jgi:hypothetical protein
MRGLTHLAETVELLNSFHLKEIEAFKGFNPKGTFSSHLYSIGYSSNFTRLPKFIEGIIDNDLNTSRIVSIKEKKNIDDDFVTQIISNTQYKNKNLNKECQQGKC